MTAPSTEVYRGAGVAIGRFRCGPEHPRFRDTGPTRGHLIVFPREPVAITHAGRPTVIADPTVAMIYNRDQAYTRAALVPAGDRCEWFAFDASAIIEARAGGDDVRPFGDVMRAPIDATTYLLARRTFEHACSPTAAARDAVDEACAHLLDRVVARAYPRPSTAPSRAHVELAEAARRLIGRRFREPLSLAQLAAALGVSAFHLARVFRAVTGETIHRHRTQLRVRAALEPIADGAPLAPLAFELGFSSHSHFTHAFRAVFGGRPSKILTAARARLRDAGPCAGRSTSGSVSLPAPRAPLRR